VKYKTDLGVEVELSHADMEKIAGMVKPTSGGAAMYRMKTEDLIANAQRELREATGDDPEDLGELYEFAVKHKLFGETRRETHIMCNTLKLMYGLLQQMTHSA
jgi:hypothetical protein